MFREQLSSRSELLPWTEAFVCIIQFRSKDICSPCANSRYVLIVLQASANVEAKLATRRLESDGLTTTMTDDSKWRT